MKYVKSLGLLVVMAAALVVFTAIASAATLTSPSGTYLDWGVEIHAESEGAIKLDGTVPITCQKSTLVGHVIDYGGEHKETKQTTRVKVLISTWDFTECGNATIEVTKWGTLDIYSKGANTATPKLHEVELTALTHSFLLGTVHCIYATENTDLGTLTGTGHSGNTTATLDVSSAPLPLKATDAACGEEARLTGSYKITTPDHLYVD